MTQRSPILIGSFNHRKMAINIVVFAIASIGLPITLYLEFTSPNDWDHLKDILLLLITIPFLIYALFADVIGPIRRSTRMKGAFACLSGAKLEFADDTGFYEVDRRANACLEYYRPKGKIYHVYRVTVTDGLTGAQICKKSLFCLKGDKQAFVDQLQVAIRSL